MKPEEGHNPGVVVKNGEKTHRQSLRTEPGDATVDTAWGTSPPTRRSPDGSCTLPGCLLGRRSSLGAQALLTPRTPGSENQHLELGVTDVTETLMAGLFETAGTMAVPPDV